MYIDFEYIYLSVICIQPEVMPSDSQLSLTLSVYDQCCICNIPRGEAKLKFHKIWEVQNSKGRGNTMLTYVLLHFQGEVRLYR